MRALIIQHTSVDTPGIITDHLMDCGVQVDIVRIDRGNEIPASVEHDVMISLGGPESLHDSGLPTWVGEEMQLMRRFIDQGQRVFGICLGAQMVASVLGARTGPNQYAEVGWHKITRVPDQKVAIQHVACATDPHSDSPLGKLPDVLTVLHWHQNTFDLPADATHLFRSNACENQGFCLGDRVVAFQFHPETMARTIEHYTKVSKLCGIPSPWVQNELEIRDGIPEYMAKQNQMLRDFLTTWLSLTKPSKRDV